MTLSAIRTGATAFANGAASVVSFVTPQPVKDACSCTAVVISPKENKVIRRLAWYNLTLLAMDVAIAATAVFAIRAACIGVAPATGIVAIVGGGVALTALLSPRAAKFLVGGVLALAGGNGLAHGLMKAAQLGSPLLVVKMRMIVAACLLGLGCRLLNRSHANERLRPYPGLMNDFMESIAVRVTNLVQSLLYEDC